jgi:hypothetical protein
VAFIRVPNMLTVFAIAYRPTNRIRSDSQVARDLQAAFDSGVEPENMSAWAMMEDTSRPRSDYDMARALQESLNNGADDLTLPVFNRNSQTAMVIEDSTSTAPTEQIEQR